MENNDQKKTVELMTLPNTEVFVNINGKIDTKSFIDDTVQRTRKFNVTSNVDDICVVGIMERPIYQVNSYNMVEKIMCRPDDFKTIVLPNNNINEGDVILDVTMEPPTISNKDRVYKYSTIKQINSSIWSESELSNFNFSFTKSGIDVDGYNLWTHNQWWADFDNIIRGSGKPSAPLLCNVIINDSVKFPICSTIIVNEGILSGLWSQYQAVSLSRNWISKIDVNAPLHLKITKRKFIVEPCMRIIGIESGRLLKHALSNEYLDTKIYNLRVKYANGDYEMRTPLTLRDMQSNHVNFGISIDMQMMGDYPIEFTLTEIHNIDELKDLKYMGINLVSLPATPGGGDNKLTFYDIIVDVEHVDDKTVKFSIPAKVLRYQYMYGAIGTELFLDSIWDGPTFTTEKPNTP